MSQKITMLKPDAIVDVRIGSRIVHELQKIIVMLVSDRSDEEMALFNQQVAEQKTEFSEPWMDAVYYTTILLKGVEEAAVLQGKTYEQEGSSISLPGN